MACGILVPQPGVRPEPLGWECQVQDVGLSENSWLQGILIGEISPGSLHLDSKTQPLNCLQSPVLDTSLQTTSKTGTQPHPLAERLPKVVLSLQTPQNTLPEVALPIRRTRSISTHQSAGTSPSYQEAYTSHWTNLTHWGQTPEARRTMTLQAAERRPQTQ